MGSEQYGTVCERAKKKRNGVWSEANKSLRFILQPGLEPAFNVHLHELHCGIRRERDREGLVAAVRMGDVRKQEVMERFEGLENHMVSW